MNIGQTTKKLSMIARCGLNDYSMTGEASGVSMDRVTSHLPARPPKEARSASPLQILVWSSPT
ncbi:MAG: hypothetical protein ACPGWR_24800 [Ardenticatenaceae bacterium]